MKRVKEMQAGRYVLACCYTAVSRGDSLTARSEKEKTQTSAQAAMNLKYSYQKCLLTIACNFEKGLFVGLSYDDMHLPPNRDAAKKEIKRFITAMRSEYRRRGAAFEYLYCTEWKHGESRLHHHMICNRIEDARELFDSLWRCGETSVQDIDPLSLQDLAKYFTKEARDDKRKVGERAWTPSKGLRRPEITVSMIPDNMTISPPAGSYILDNPSFRNEYGTGETAFYILPPARKN